MVNRVSDTCVLVLQKMDADGSVNESYVFLFDEDSRAATLRTFGRFASTPDLSFNWYDAAVLSKKLRAMTGQPK